MKIKNWKHSLLPVIICLITLTLFFLQYCKKDYVCHSTILIKNRYTNKPVPNAKILITCGDPPVPKCTINDSGVTSAEGKYLYDRPLEAILYVQAFVDSTTKTPLTSTVNTSQFYGWDFLYLKAGKNVDLTILVDTSFKVQ